MFSKCPLIVAALALGLVGAASAIASGPDFRPDIKLSGENLKAWHTLGQAEWKAENGEIIGRPNKTGGWLVFNNSYQDIQFYAEYKCTVGCVTGLLMRAETTPDGGMKGVYVSLSDTTNEMENLAGYDITIDAQGKIVSATREQRGGGFMRVISPWPPKPEPQRARRGGGGPGGFRREMPADLPIHPPDARYRPNDWNSVEFSFDANVVRANLNDGGQRGSLAAEGYGPIALYIGGDGEVRYRSIAIADLSLKTREPNYTSSEFRKQTLNDFYYGWGQAAADFNHDGHLDIASGPFVYYGPDFTKRREIWRGEATDPTNDFAMDSHEEFAGAFTGHPEWPDLITVKFGGGHCVYLYVNPRGERRIWQKYPVVDNVSSEISIVADVDGPGKPALVFTSGGYVRYAEPDPANPTAPWIVHNVSERGYATGHGLGAGDINGDGLVDILDPYGWWEHPKPGSDQTWKYHPVAFAQYGRGMMGGAVMVVYDVNGDGLNDVVTSLNAHGWGLAWFEQKRDKQGSISFVKHMVMDDFSTKNAGGVVFSELHGSGVGDINGDGIPDFLVGKRWYSHLDSGIDPYTFGPPVLYWYETVRDPKAPGGAKLVPHLIDNESGVGNTVLAVDLNHGGAMDIVTSTRFGTFIFWNKRHEKTQARAGTGTHPRRDRSSP